MTGGGYGDIERKEGKFYIGMQANNHTHA